MSRKKSHFYYIDLLRFFAVCLITNSHMDSIYPHASLATGGAMGNAVFFAISGLCLSVPEKGEIGAWILRRIQRIYLPVFLAGLFLFVILEQRIHSFADFLSLFVYPTRWWFVGAIVLYYALFLLFVFRMNRKHQKILAVCTALLYAVLYIFFLDTSVWSIEKPSGHFQWVFYFEVMLLAYLSRDWLQEIVINRKQKLLFLFLQALLFVIYYSFKFLMSKFPALFSVQFLVHVLTLVFLWFLFLAGKGCENRIRKFLTGKPLGKLAAMLSSFSLEVYLVQEYIIEKASVLSFPINFVTAVILIILFAILLGTLCNAISRLIRKKLLQKRGI